MCRNCVDEYGGIAEGEQPSGEVEAAAFLISKLYQFPGCGVGGPLHVVVDDFNVEDEFLHVSDTWDADDDAVIIARGIIDLLRPLSLRDRAWACLLG